ncbi:MFS transporter [Dokdonella koreensis]|uniref:1-acyl-sn-glycerol-3-phosphate acyltransferase n=1 Tax=Dokdonella koreensis DS-123 TaxID=1300342 RepID=A0A160DXV1_9GAMM|nr:MFS transporter [Dokdonella koreensis]ANB19220.1 1-acyl-sn-glycerol-3-phosphate acyltransferase [Dokdonella koreensis DS-123]
MPGHNQFSLLRERRFLPFFVTQSLGAFNDNVYRNAMLMLIVYQLGLSTEQGALYANLAPALFILPYFLFSATAGQIAEKYEKAALIRVTTTMEIVIMSIAAIGFVTKTPAILLGALFLTGLQSTLFGPVKYSILPQALKPEELTGGNGLVEMGTSISILLGMIVGTSLMRVGTIGPVVAAVAVVALAISGYLVSRAIPRAPAAAPDLKISWIPVAESLSVMRLVRKQRAVRNAVLGISWFWFMGTALTAQLPNYAQIHLGGAENLYLLALALFSVGTGLGSLLCEKLSARTVEIGLVPLGALGMTVFCIDLYFARPGEAAAAGLSVAEFVAQPGSWRIMVDLALVGVFAGFYVVPLFALIQSRTPKDELSRVIAGLNIQNAVFIVAAAVLGIVAQQVLGLSIPQVFLAVGVLTAIVTAVIFSIVPEFFMRFLSWVLTRLLYRVEVHGVEAHVPDEGPALLVCNHVSYMDALLIAGQVPRPVRFVMYHRIFAIPVLSWIFRTAKAIPIAGAREDPVLMQRAFDAIDQALADGEIVAIFPEGALTKDGAIGPFKSGVEKILARRPVPVVPMALRGMWASMWSKRDSRLGRLRVPRRFRARVELVAAPPLAAADATAETLETQVRALRGDAA